MISLNLQKVFTDAVNYARANKHEYITTEHIFLYLLQSKSITNLLTQMQIDVHLLDSQLREYILKNTPQYPEEFIDEDPLETVTLTHTIEQMVTHASLSGKSESTVEDMFVYILKDESAYCTYLLHQQGLERVDILEEISHGDLSDEKSLKKSNFWIQKRKKNKNKPLWNKIVLS